jgi:hypothetical protein
MPSLARLAASLVLSLLAALAVWGLAESSRFQPDLPLAAGLALGVLAAALVWLARYSAERGYDRPPRFD